MAPTTQAIIRVCAVSQDPCTPFRSCHPVVVRFHWPLSSTRSTFGADLSAPQLVDAEDSNGVLVAETVVLHEGFVSVVGVEVLGCHQSHSRLGSLGKL